MQRGNINSLLLQRKFYYSHINRLGNSGRLHGLNFKLRIDVVADETPALAFIAGRRALVAADDVHAKRLDLRVLVPRIHHSEHVAAVVSKRLLSQVRQRSLFQDETRASVSPWPRLV